MTTAALLLAAFCCTGGAALLDVVVAPRRRSLRPAPYLLLAAGSVVVAVAGVRADIGHGGTLDLGGTLGFGHTVLRADPLAGLFLAVTGVIAVPVMLVFSGWVRHDDAVPYRGIAGAAALTVAAVMVVVLADDAFVFLFGWEGLSVAFYLLSGYRRDAPGQSRAAMLTFTFSKISGALLLLAFGLLVGATGSFHLADWASVTGAAHDAAYALALVAFAAKVGVVPLQVWMPTGYGAASGPGRALMSAVAANAGFYGMWRTLQILGKPPTWLAVVLLISAAFTALLGIAHAAVQRDLQRVIAYSSVENGGLITAGFAIALAGAAAGEQQLTALGLLTASLQMIAHSLAKSSLFLASAVIEQRTGRRDLDQLRGVGRELPLAGTVFSVGAFTLAGLPLTVGLVSEWYLLESVMQLFRLHALVLELSFAVAGALIALALGFAGFTFVRLVGLTILGGVGAPERVPPSRINGLGSLATLGLWLPAVGCVTLAVVSPWEFRFLAHGLSALVPASTTASALSEPWVLQPVYPGFSALSPSWLAVELPILAAAVVAFALAASSGAMLRVRRVPAWRSATGGVAGDARYSPFAFATPTRHVLGNLLMTRSRLAQLDHAAAEEADKASTLPGPDMPPGEQERSARAVGSTGGGGSGGAAAQVTIDGPAALEGAEQNQPSYSTDVVEVVEAYMYQPVVSLLRRLVSTAKRLQSGRLDAYIAYMLVTVVALIAVVVGLS